MNSVELTRAPELDYATSEALNTLATSLSFCGEDVRCVEITSRYAGEGKSTVSFNLARVLASLGKRVVFLDADLRRSNLTKRYGLEFSTEEGYGLAHYLAGHCQMKDILYSTNEQRLYVIPVGRTVNSSLQLLSSARLKLLIEYLRKSVDMVIVDTAPVGAIVDALEVAKYCDGALIVTGYKKGTCRELQLLKDKIQRTNCPVFGTVLNNVPMKKFANRRYYYSYYKGYQSYYGNEKK